VVEANKQEIAKQYTNAKSRVNGEMIERPELNDTFCSGTVVFAKPELLLKPSLKAKSFNHLVNKKKTVTFSLHYSFANTT